MDTVIRPHPDIHVLPSHVPMPGGEGFLPVNAFVLLAWEPVLIDTGLAFESNEFLDALQAIIDPALSDGCSLPTMMPTIPEASNASSSSLRMPVSRLMLFARSGCQPSGPCRWTGYTRLTRAKVWTLATVKLTAVAPPLFDNPMSTAIRDDKTGAFFSVDCFGAVIPQPAQSAGDISEDDLKMGMVMWATSDSPWAHIVDKAKFGRSLDRVRQLNASLILSSHLPPASGSSMENFLEVLTSVPDAEPFVAPNQAALEQMMRSWAAKPMLERC